MREDRDFRDLIISSEIEECNTYVEVYWKMLALKKRKVWLSGSWRLPYLGTDEYFRRTLAFGPFVFALWPTTECKLIASKLEEKFNYMLNE